MNRSWYYDKGLQEHNVLINYMTSGNLKCTYWKMGVYTCSRIELCAYTCIEQYA